MKVLVLADLHFDFWIDTGIDPFAGIEDQIAALDLLILAGDVTNKPKVRWPIAFRHMSALLSAERIAVIPGNHDFYQFRLDGEEKLAEIAADHGVRYANDGVVTLGDIRFLCATLWTDLVLPPGLDINAHTVSQRMNDYRFIRVASGGYRRMRPADMVQRHRAHRQFLERALQTPHGGRTMVVTHHAPVPDVLTEKYDPLAAAYASDLSDVIRAGRPDRWFYGHAHGGRDIDMFGCQITNVSLGYPHKRYPDPAARVASLIRTV